jgi:alpha-beta hydrolase superfamily lysophospholipase
VGGYNHRFEGTGAKTGYEWLSRDPERCLAYAADPDCGFMFSLSGYRALFDLVGAAQSSRVLQGTPADLPILVISGSDDPVGAFGEAPARVFRELKRAGVDDVELDLVEGGRHEILGETCADDVVAELVEWIASKTARSS